MAQKPERRRARAREPVPHVQRRPASTALLARHSGSRMHQEEALRRLVVGLPGRTTEWWAGGCPRAFETPAPPGVSRRGHEFSPHRLLRSRYERESAVKKKSPGMASGKVRRNPAIDEANTSFLAINRRAGTALQKLPRVCRQIDPVALRKIRRRSRLARTRMGPGAGGRSRPGAPCDCHSTCRSRVPRGSFATPAISNSARVALAEFPARMSVGSAVKRVTARAVERAVPAESCGKLLRPIMPAPAGLDENVHAGFPAMGPPPLHRAISRPV